MLGTSYYSTGRSNDWTLKLHFIGDHVRNPRLFYSLALNLIRCMHIIVLFKSKHNENMIFKTNNKHRSRNNESIPMIWMFPYWIQYEKDIKEDFIKLVYSKIFHLISPLLDPSTREGWASLTLLRVAMVCSLSLWKSMDKVSKAWTLNTWGGLAHLSPSGL